MNRWVRRGLVAFGGLVLLAAVGVAMVFVTSTRPGPLPEDAPGYAVLQIPAPDRGRDIALHVWYPAAPNRPVSLIAQNALFYGFHGRLDASGDGDPHPVILLSHGSGGNAPRLGWIAASLAAQGFIVAATNHPGTTSGDSMPALTVRPWERTADLRAILDAMGGGALPPGVSPDLERVGVLGYSLGGATALLSGGARLSKDAFIAYCDRNADAADCAWLRDGGVDFAAIDQARYEADQAVPGIGVVVAVDPALSQAMKAESLSAIDVPVLLVNLGTPESVPVAMDASTLAMAIPGARHAFVDGAAHFSFLARCSGFGVFMIALAGDDNICSDRGLRDRAAVQAELQTLIGDFFATGLVPE